MGRGGQISADAFIDSSDAKYNGAVAFAKCPFARIICNFRLGARRFGWCKALAVRVALCFRRAKGGVFSDGEGELLHDSFNEIHISPGELCIFLEEVYK